jgi:uncharacterized protein (DUF2062 family)
MESEVSSPQLVGSVAFGPVAKLYFIAESMWWIKVAHLMSRSRRRKREKEKGHCPNTPFRGMSQCLNFL